MKCLGLSLHDVLRLKKIGFDYFKKKPLHYIDFFFPGSHTKWRCYTVCFELKKLDL